MEHLESDSRPTRSSEADAGALESLAELITQTVRCDRTVIFELVRHGRQVRFAEVLATGDQRSREATESIEGLSAFDYLRDPDRPRADAWPSDFWPIDDFGIVDIEMIGARNAHALHWIPSDIGSTLGMLIAHKGVLLGGIWGVRRANEPRFGRAQLRRARRATTEIKERFVEICERRQLASRPPGARSVVAFDHRGQTIAVSPDAAPWISSASAMDQLNRIAAQIAATKTTCLTRFVRRAPVHLRRLEGHRRIVVALAVEGDRYRPGAREKLTRAQREVAELAVVGATIKEIARALDRRPATVHHHLKGIYNRLGVGSRSELAQVMERSALKRA